MNDPLIDGVKIKELKILPDERGKLMEILRSDESIFEGFGQAYVTVCKPRVVKGWHYHKEQVDHFVCLQGMAKVVLYDPRQNSKTYRVINEFLIGWQNPLLVKIPTYVYHGFTAAGTEDAMILNLPTEVYRYSDPDEFRANPFTSEIPYDWGDVDKAVSR
ncbi:MAG: dTDP-4-dehydrorhamnose 3,5-epimerase [Omnitrophica bacterium RIFCSPLOWO2_01_FULL_45_10b]|nr:MAG: dTDP-4-dehydrorhamnose 3,5-epimerase [Omnitrophica bacterium RIFCSPLOWO2_01_FULL_45_10b]